MTDGQTKTGILIVDHGSRRAESNNMLLQVVGLYTQTCEYSIVEPAHMELAEPTIAMAFDRCVERGANRVVVMPYFLLPGKHWHQDIPQLSRDAAAKHPGVQFLVTAPLGLSSLMPKVIDARIDECLSCVNGYSPDCDVCRGSERCLHWQH